MYLIKIRIACVSALLSSLTNLTNIEYRRSRQQNVLLAEHCSFFTMIAWRKLRRIPLAYNRQFIACYFQRFDNQIGGLGMSDGLLIALLGSNVFVWTPIFKILILYRRKKKFKALRWTKRSSKRKACAWWFVQNQKWSVRWAHHVKQTDSYDKLRINYSWRMSICHYTFTIRQRVEPSSLFNGWSTFRFYPCENWSVSM